MQDEWPDVPNSVPSYERLSPKMEEYDSHKSLEAELMGTVAHLQLEFAPSVLPALAKRTLPALSKPVAFTSTKVPKFFGDTIWDEYRQVFDTIGWVGRRYSRLATLVPPGR